MDCSSTGTPKRQRLKVSRNITTVFYTHTHTNVQWHPVCAEDFISRISIESTPFLFSIRCDKWSTEVHLPKDPDYISMLSCWQRAHPDLHCVRDDKMLFIEQQGRLLWSHNTQFTVISRLLSLPKHIMFFTHAKMSHIFAHCGYFLDRILPNVMIC